MPNPFDAFLATQGRMAQNEGQQLINRANLQKIAEAERAQKMQADTLAFYQKQAALPATTLANLSEMKEVPDAGAESQGLRQMAKEPTPAPKKISAAESLMSSADEAGRMAKELQSINPAEADRLRKERDNLLTKAAPLLKEERAAKQEENAQVMQWMGAVKDEPSFQNVMAQIKQFKPEMYKAWAEMQLPNGAPAFPRNLDGSFAYTPQTQKITETVAKASMKEYERAQVAEKIEDNKRADLELERRKKADEDRVRHDKAVEANQREGNQIRREALDVRAEVKETTTETTEARRLRKEVETKIKPLDKVQQNITQAKELLALSTPASDLQLQMRLTDVFDKARATNMLFSANKNFGSIAGRVEGFIGRAFTGQYTDSQRREIRQMLDGMENDVIRPARAKINDHYGKIAKKSGVDSDLVVDPDLYASTPTAPTNPQAEADAFMKGLLGGKS